MEQETKKLLEECSCGCRMAVNSMNQVGKYVTESALDSVITDCKEKHEQLGKRADDMLKNAGEHGKDPGAAASAFSWLSTEMKMKMKDDSAEISKIMMDGCNMGIQSISGIMNECTQASPESMSLAKELVSTEEAFMKDLKQFL